MPHSYISAACVTVSMKPNCKDQVKLIHPKSEKKVYARRFSAHHIGCMYIDEH